MQSVGLGTARADVGHDKDGYRTHEYGAAFELVETIYDGDDTLDYVRDAISLAERNNFWIPKQCELYRRMADYGELVRANTPSGMGCNRPSRAVRTSPKSVK